jgi:hypothetical protein
MSAAVGAPVTDLSLRCALHIGSESQTLDRLSQSSRPLRPRNPRKDPAPPALSVPSSRFSPGFCHGPSSPKGNPHPRHDAGPSQPLPVRSSRVGPPDLLILHPSSTKHIED